MYPAREYVMPYLGRHTEFFLGGGGVDIESICNLCLVLKVML